MYGSFLFNNFAVSLVLFRDSSSATLILTQFHFITKLIIER